MARHKRTPIKSTGNIASRVAARSTRAAAQGTRKSSRTPKPALPFDDARVLAAAFNEAKRGTKRKASRKRELPTQANRAKAKAQQELNKKKRRIFVETVDEEDDSDDETVDPTAVVATDDPLAPSTPTKEELSIDIDDGESWAAATAAVHAQVHMFNHKRRAAFPDHSTFMCKFVPEFAENDFDSLLNALNEGLKDMQKVVTPDDGQLSVFCRQNPAAEKMNDHKKTTPLRSIKDLRGLLNVNSTHMVDHLPIQVS
jgi:hypothetical protein